MNTLSVCDEMWVESMESVQLNMSGYFLQFTVKNEAWNNGTVVVISEHEDNIPPSIMTEQYTFSEVSHRAKMMEHLHTFLGCKTMI